MKAGRSDGTAFSPKLPLDIRIFAALFVLLVLSFYFLPDQAGRNIILYVTALSAHVFLRHSAAGRVAFGHPGGWFMLLLVATPTLSLLWSRGADADRVKDLLVAAYSVLAIYLGLAWVLDARRSEADRLAVLLLLAGNIAGGAAIGYWLIRETLPGAMRLEGLWGIDNPVHGSVLLLAGTIPVISQILAGRRSRWWLAGAIVPVSFVTFAGARGAAGAYLAILLVMGVTSNLRVVMGVLAAAFIGGAGLLLLMGTDAANEIWLSRGVSFRGVVWEQVWAAYQACNPLIGCGVATRLVVDLGAVTGDRAHSIYLAALYHQGIIGVIVFLGSLGGLLWRGFRSGGGTRDWSWFLAYVLIADATSGHHVLVRAALFWLCFWLPVMIVAATSRENAAPMST